MERELGHRRKPKLLLVAQQCKLSKRSVGHPQYATPAAMLRVGPPHALIPEPAKAHYELAGLMWRHPLCLALALLYKKQRRQHLKPLDPPLDQHPSLLLGQLDLEPMPGYRRVAVRLSPRVLWPKRLPS